MKTYPGPEGREDSLEEKKNSATLRGNMTEGNVTKVLLLFTIPTFLTNFLNALYNTADSIVIGQFAGAGALAAVGANAFLTNMLVAVFSGAGAGGAPRGGAWGRFCTIPVRPASFRRSART